MALAIGAAVTLPSWFMPSTALHHDLHPYLMVAWLLVVGHAVVQAIREPTPARVQSAVKTCILGLIGLDALVAVAVVGWPGLWILLLLPPALLLGRWVYST
jgi:4-hydroxybenzoate polyprenyltransferase